MTLHIALLRAVNLGAHNKIAMPRLCEFFAQVGLANPRSLLQSGNVMFDGTKRTTAKLETLLETEAKKRLALETDFFVRTAEEWKTIVAHNPFPEEAARDPGHLLVMCLKAAPDAASVKALQAGISGPEVVRAVGRQVYITYPAGIGPSRLTITIIERKLGTRGTGRNWNTVMKLGALAAPGG
jgi:uncharacterized protein (DUF1697 family)